MRPLGLDGDPGAVAELDIARGFDFAWLSLQTPYTPLADDTVRKRSSWGPVAFGTAAVIHPVSTPADACVCDNALNVTDPSLIYRHERT